MSNKSHFIVNELRRASEEFSKFPHRLQKPPDLLRSIARLRVKVGGLFEAACDARLIPDVMPKDRMRELLLFMISAPKVLSKSERFSFGVWISVAMPWLRRLRTGHLRAQAGDFYCPKVVTDKNGSMIGLDNQILDGFGIVRATGAEEIRTLVEKHPELDAMSAANLSAFFKAHPDWGGRIQRKTIGTEKVNTDDFDDSDWLSWLSEGAADDADGCRALADFIEACHRDSLTLTNDAVILLALLRLAIGDTTGVVFWNGCIDSFSAKRLPEGWGFGRAEAAYVELREAKYVAESSVGGGMGFPSLRVVTCYQERRLPLPKSEAGKSQNRLLGGIALSAPSRHRE